MGSFADVQRFPLEWKHPEFISANHRKPRDGEGLGGVSLRKNERALVGQLATGLVSVLQFRNPQDAFRAALFRLEDF